jgi:hypothetical protein
MGSQGQAESFGFGASAIPPLFSGENAAEDDLILIRSENAPLLLQSSNSIASKSKIV